MHGLYSDTHPKMEALQIQFIRRMPSWKKFAIVDGLNETVKTLATDPEQSVYVTSPENVILSKLEWYRMGGEV